MNWLKNAKVKTKMFVLVIVSIAFTMLIGATGYYYLNKANANSTVMYEGNLTSIIYLEDAMATYKDTNTDRFEFMITLDATRNQQLADQIKTQTTDIDDLISKYGATQLDSSEKSSLDALKSDWESSKQVASDIDKLSAANQNVQAYAMYIAKLETLNQKIVQELSDLIKYNKDDAAKIAQENKDSGAKAGLIVIALVVISVAISLWISLFIIRLISVPLVAMSGYLSMVAKGDLSLETLSASRKTELHDDEIGVLGKAVVNMRQNLSELLLKVTDSSEQIAASSEELTANTEQASAGVEDVAQAIMVIASGSNNQMRAVSETSGVISHMSGNIQQLAENSQSTARAAEQTLEATRKGELAIQKTKTQMDTIEQTVQGLNGIIHKLGDRSSEIGQIVGAISAIADQTNLLALNAAIEAARAGEQGRGFAVVAEEVRKLAEESQKATKQISDLVAQIQNDTGQAVTAMTNGTEQVRIGMEVVGTAGTSFSNISELVQQMGDQIQGISNASKNISEGSQKVVRAMDSVESVTGEVSEQSQTISATAQQQTAAMHEISDASHNLAQIAEEMMSEVQKFKL